MNIQWYPGHMTKTRRQIEADLKHVDIVAEIIDARIPISSRNPDIDAICADKPRLIVLLLQNFFVMLREKRKKK